MEQVKPRKTFEVDRIQLFFDDGGYLMSGDEVVLNYGVGGIIQNLSREEGKAKLSITLSKPIRITHVGTVGSPAECANCGRKLGIFKYNDGEFLYCSSLCKMDGTR